MMIAILYSIVVKIILAPYFFTRLVRTHNVRFASESYLSGPIVLLCIAILGTITKANFFQDLAMLATIREEYLVVAFWSILVSIFLVINRKGILPQILGILSLENSIIAFALFAGLEQSAGLQFGITFDILIWIIVAALFTGIIYRKFGSLDVNKMNELTE
jgi:hydrogenase-4 membrane subunit HyfE